MSPGTPSLDGCAQLELDLTSCNRWQHEVAELLNYLRGGAIRYAEAYTTSFGCRVVIHYLVSNGNALPAIKMRLMQWAMATLGKAETVAMSMSTEQVTFLVQLACSPKLLAGKRGLVIMALLTVCDENLEFRDPASSADLMALAGQVPEVNLALLSAALHASSTE